MVSRGRAARVVQGLLLAAIVPVAVWIPVSLTNDDEDGGSRNVTRMPSSSRVPLSTQPSRALRCNPCPTGRTCGQCAARASLATASRADRCSHGQLETSRKVHSCSSCRVAKRRTRLRLARSTWPVPTCSTTSRPTRAAPRSSSSDGARSGLAGVRRRCGRASMPCTWSEGTRGAAGSRSKTTHPAAFPHRRGVRRRAVRRPPTPDRDVGRTTIRRPRCARDAWSFG